MSEEKRHHTGSMMTTGGEWVIYDDTMCLELWGPHQRNLIHSLHFKWSYREMSGAYRDFVFGLCVHAFSNYYNLDQWKNIKNV